MPPLRDRRGDIPELIEFFVDKVNRDLGTAIVGVSDEAREVLMRHAWPGNVRELENTLLRAAVLARGRTLVSEDFALAGTDAAAVGGGRCRSRRRSAGALAELLDADSGATGRATSTTTLIAAVERPLIEVVLERAGGNQVKAAEMLGINRNTLRKKITDLGIDAEARAGGPR